ncbi:HIRAN domain-containing protein [Hymenobacter sp. BT175]|uniref:HIRAN domain-containing protein n=1 Tax=Hymenobacter translucens TaxID=2886507 RepID=UPI001D0E4AE3|nr:HIRAN domain-containing protein [Hymenobacter translucens]MCC2548440.1 HIRAN domain-containing protein [Hymenobacter translucens]
MNTTYPSLPPTGLVLLECLVAGTTHRENLRQHEPGLLVGQVLQLVREPDSKYDDWAVKVLTTAEAGELWLGYLPEVRNETVARLLDAGFPIAARLTHKDWEDEWLQLEIEVLLPGQHA